MRRRTLLSISAVFPFVVLAATLFACGDGGGTTPSSTPGPGATRSFPTDEPITPFDCPAEWTKYACPTVSENKGALTAPFRAGVEAEMICQNIGYYTSGVINDKSILFKLPTGTEIVSPVDGTVVSARAAPAPHEYTKSIAIGGMPFLIYVHFVGDIKVEENAPLKRGQVIGVSTGTFPTDAPPDSKLLGSSVAINLLRYDSRMINASDAELWVGGVPTCYAP